MTKEPTSKKEAPVSSYSEPDHLDKQARTQQLHQRPSKSDSFFEEDEEMEDEENLYK